MTILKSSAFSFEVTGNHQELTAVFAFIFVRLGRLTLVVVIPSFEENWNHDLKRRDYYGTFGRKP